MPATQIGTTEIRVDGQWLEVAVYQPGSFDWEPIEVRTETGWGVLNVVDPSEGDTPLEVWTQSRGWQVIATEELEVIIDDFEHNNIDAHYFIADTRGTPQTRTQAARSGTYGWYGSIDARSISLPASHSNYNSSVQPQTLDYYPKSGDVFEIWLNIIEFLSGGPSINRFYFGKQDYEESGTGYRIWWTLDDGYWRIEKRQNGSGSTFEDSRRVNWGSLRNQWLRCEIDWRGSGFTVTIEDSSGNEIDSLSTTDTTFTSGGIGYDNGQYTTSYTDDWRLLEGGN